MHLRTGKASRSLKLSYIIAFAAVVAASVLAAMYSQMKEHTKEVLDTEVSRRTARVISEAIDSCLAEDSNSCVTLIRDSSGSVASAQADAHEVNALENKLKTAVNKALEDMTESDISVPAGTLTDIAPFVGKGPKLSIGLEQYGTADVVLESSFDGAGVNQVRHRLVLKIDVRIRAILAGDTQTVTSHDEYIVSETLITGRPLAASEK